MNTTNAIPLSLTDNLWSNIRWQWWQPFFLGACNRTTTWFHHRSCPRCCGKPVTPHLGNPLNFWFIFFRLSLVSMHSTQNIIFNCSSKGNTLPNGSVLGVEESLVFHDDNAKHESDLSAARPPLNPYSSTNHLLAPGPFVHGRKSVPMGGTP